MIVVKEGESSIGATSPVLLTSLESTILTKIEEIDGKLREEKDPEKLQRLGALLSTLLENLEKIRRMKRA